MKEKIELEIGYESIVRVAVVGIGILLLWLIREIIVLFFIVLVITAALSPVVDRWSKRMNRLAAISLIYIIIVAAITLIALIIFPPLIYQIQQLASDLPNYFGNLIPILNSNSELLDTSREGLTTIAKELSGFGQQVFSATLGVFGGLVAVFTIIVLTFYLLLEEQGAKKFILEYLPLENRQKIVLVLQKIGNKMGAWLRGQLLLGLIIGLIDGVGLALLGVPFALTLGFWSGITELIPYVGPVIGAVPGVVIAFGISPLIGVLTLALYILVQQLEANFLVPKVMQKAVGLSPVIIILAILIGAKIAGLLGVVLAIPVAAAIGVIISSWADIQKLFKR